MAQYFNKNALVAEINKRIIDAPINNIGHQRVWAYNDVKDILDTIEMKEVDIDREIGRFFNDDCWKDGALKEEHHDMIEFAKHFFELGLKAQKGE